MLLRRSTQSTTINGSQITTKQLGEECLLRHGKDVLEGEINRKLLEQELRKRNKTVTQRDVDAEEEGAAGGAKRARLGRL